MFMARLALALLILIPAASFSQSATPAKLAPGFSLDTIDKSTDPCVDFYQYACGNWIKNAEIPADQAQWVSFVELHERNLDVEHEILEKAAQGGSSRSAIDQKIGDLYGSCMDEKTVNSKGIAALKPELDRIDAVKDKQALIDEIAHVHLTGPTPLFNFYSASDLHNADQVIAYIDQGGLSLPDRDYYLKDDERMKGVRQTFTTYMNEVFTQAASGGMASSGSTPDQSAQTVLRIETAIAKAEMDRTARRDPKNRDHKMSRQEAAALGTEFFSRAILHRSEDSGIQGSECLESGIFQTDQHGTGHGIAGCVEDLCEVACPERGCALAVAAFRGCEFQIATGPHRTERESSAVEALRESCGPRNG